MKRTKVGPTEPYKLVSFMLEKSIQDLEKETVNKDYIAGKVYVYKEMLGIILSDADAVEPIRKMIEEEEKIDNETNTTLR